MKSGKVKFKTLKEVMDEEIKGNKERELAVEAERAKLIMAEKLVEIRERQGMTQAELAKRLRVSQQVISRIESGENNLTLTTLIKLLAVYGIVLKIGIGKKSGRHRDAVEFV